MNFPIIDAHHHIWRRDFTPWLQGPVVPRIFGDYAPIRRDYSLEEFRQESAPCGVVQSVYVQVNVGPGDEVAEVAWVNGHTDRPAAITAFANLAAPNVGSVLDAELAAGNVRAVRQQLHWHTNPQYRFASRPDLFNEPAWRAGLAEAGARGLAFELQVFPGQMKAAANLVQTFPDITFVLIHAGMLEDRSAGGWAEWRRELARLASLPNCMTKLSGLGTFLRRCDLDVWEPVVRPTVDLFGAERCMFGSNFPIEKLWTSYAHLVEVMQEAVTHLSTSDQTAIFASTAARVYGIQLP